MVARFAKGRKRVAFTMTDVRLRPIPSARRAVRGARARFPKGDGPLWSGRRVPPRGGCLPTTRISSIPRIRLGRARPKRFDLPPLAVNDAPGSRWWSTGPPGSALKGCLRKAANQWANGPPLTTAPSMPISLASLHWLTGSLSAEPATPRLCPECASQKISIENGWF